jgi:RNA-directed DNA polymerase
MLGYSVTIEKKPRLRVAESSVKRLQSKLREIFRGAQGRSVTNTIEELTPVLRGWVQYFKLNKVRGPFEELDRWIRRKLRCILWRQWKRIHTRAKNLMQRGLSEEHAWQSATNGRGPWWNAGASHMNAAYAKSFFDQAGLVSLLDTMLKAHNLSRTAVYGTVRTVV